jgi:hypothetical protein
MPSYEVANAKDRLTHGDRGADGSTLGDVSVPVESPSSSRAWTLLAVSAGIVLFAGLVLDVWTHRYRPTSDVGHSVLVVGATAVVVGAAMLLLAPLLDGAGSSRSLRFLQVAAPVVAVGVIGPVAIAAVSASTRQPAAPSGAPAAADHDHAVTSSAAADAAPPAATDPSDPGLVLAGEIQGNKSLQNVSHDHGHGSVVVPDQPLDDATRAQLGKQLEVARATAMAFPTVADATRAGYIEVTPFVPLIGAHYLNPAYVDGTFDPTHPEMLLYDGTNPDSKIVGLSYFVSSRAGEPAGFAGPNDHWHQHIGLCIRGHLVVGGEKLTADQCLARGGKKIALADMWMVHVWAVPGWDSPQGVFSPEHQDLLTTD